MEDKMEYDLKLILQAGREKKGYSQRKLARKIGIHHSSLNDIENGRIKKIDIEVLRKISEELDLSLDLLLNASGYDQVAYMFQQSSNPPSRKATKNFKKLLGEYRISQMELLDDAFQKRDNVRNCRTRLHSLILKLDNYDVYKDIWTIEKINEELKEINQNLIKSAEKYDYSKLPKDGP